MVDPLRIFFVRENHDLPAAGIWAYELARVVRKVAIRADVGSPRVFFVRQNHNFLTIRIRARKFTLLVIWRVFGTACPLTLRHVMQIIVCEDPQLSRCRDSFA